MRTLLLAVLAALVGCASASREADTAQVAPTAQLDSTVAPAAPNAVASANVEREFKPPQGFKPKILEWSIVYCKKMTVLGTRFPKEVCMTEAQLKDHVATNEAMGRDMDRTSRICSNPANCGGG
jgi:hypothetical protein